MKHGTLYAKKLKSAYSKFRGAAGKPSPDPVEPIEQLILAVLSQETSMPRARKAFKQLRNDMVDYNELRVSTPGEVADSIGRHVPRSVQRAKVLLRVLNAVYQREYAVSLAALNGKGVREMKSYLEGLDGITPYVSASLLLWSLGGHAIPVNDLTLAVLKEKDLVEAGADAAEVQAFLERNISAAEARSFSADLEAYAAGGAADDKRSTGRPATRKKTAPRPKKTNAQRKTAKNSARKKTSKR